MTEAVAAPAAMPARAARVRSERSAGSESACVSRPMKSGPVMPCAARYSTIACVMARKCTSLKAVSRALPRCPEVPNATAWSGFETSGTSS